MNVREHLLALEDEDQIVLREVLKPLVPGDGPELRGGIRIENQYLVTENGVENLTPFDTSIT